MFEAHGDNVALVATDPANDAIFGDADVIVRGRYVNQRMAVAPMEPHGAAASAEADGRLHRVRLDADAAPPPSAALRARSASTRHEVHVITPHVGGGFGGKAGLYPEQAIVAAAARALVQRPVTWMSTRSEDMLALGHSRGQIQYVELGCRRDGTFTGLRVRLVGDAGAYPGIGAFLPTGTKRMSNGTYAFDAIQFDVVVAVTNTTPTGAYRGAGRPEATALLERLVDQAAIELRHRSDRAAPQEPAHRRRLPVHDAHRRHLRQRSLPRSRSTRRPGWPATTSSAASRRRAASGATGSCSASASPRYVEITAGGGTSEYGAVEVHDDGSATVMAGTSAHGQGHQTAFAMIVSAQTGIPVERIRLVQSDTDLVRSGGGTGGSRSLQLGGSAVHRATEALVEKARRLAAHLLEADVADIVVDTDTGTLGVAGVPATALDWAALAAAAASAPDGVVDHADGTLGLAAQLDFDQGDATFPFGAHIAVVEVDHDTGRVELLRHIAVDDCGTVLNPLLVEGQQHGGVAAGVSQALYESVRLRRRRQPAHRQLHRLRASPRRPSSRASRCTAPRPRRRSTRSARRASARRARSAARRPCRTP